MESHCLPETPENSPYLGAVAKSLGIRKSRVTKETEAMAGDPARGQVHTTLGETSGEQKDLRQNSSMEEDKNFGRRLREG